MSEKAVFRFVLTLSVVVFCVVVILNRKIIPPPASIPSFVYSLPLLNAFINGTCSVLLVVSLLAVRRKNISLHRKLNLTTFCLSSLFLVSYITYHYMAQETSFPKENSLRPVYLTILVSHIILAAGVLPLILMSFYHGLNNNIQKHRKLTRWSFPIWLYVTVTGVVVYLLISPYYTH